MTEATIADGTGHGETILVVEDDADLRALAARLLSRLGYRVLQAGGGAALAKGWGSPLRRKSGSGPPRY